MIYINIDKNKPGVYSLPANSRMIDEIKNIPGIGLETFEKIKPFITI